MNTFTSEIEEKLSKLLRKTNDTEIGFKIAAEKIDNIALKNYFLQKAQERHGFLLELNSELQTDNLKLDRYLQVADDTLQTWLNVKALLSKNQEEVILEEIIKGELYAISDYNDLLNEMDLPSRVGAILSAQKYKIENGLSTIKHQER